RCAPAPGSDHVATSANLFVHRTAYNGRLSGSPAQILSKATGATQFTVERAPDATLAGEDLDLALDEMLLKGGPRNRKPLGAGDDSSLQC
ncbi:MAG: hypothetical protein AAGA03_19820, partial [Planctomycetota bacterium]